MDIVAAVVCSSVAETYRIVLGRWPTTLEILKSLDEWLDLPPDQGSEWLKWARDDARGVTVVDTGTVWRVVSVPWLVDNGLV